MAEKFVLPFANAGLRRLPTTSERATGFPCGPADSSLFNGLFHDIQAELGHLIEYAGFTDSSDDLQQVRKAIEALISAAVGGIEFPEGEEGEGPDLTGFLLLNQARVRLPIFPIIQTADNRINVSSPGTGSILVPPTVGILHRGIYPLSTSDFTEMQRTFATSANKTYHLRLNLQPGAEALSLRDLSNAGYNPSSLAETVVGFDTTYDDMLLARVVTNGSNVATITNLRNGNILEDDITGTATPAPDSNNGSEATVTANYNWGRRPRIWSTQVTIGTRPLRAAGNPGSTGFLASDPHDHDEEYSFPERTRYRTQYRMLRDYAHSFSYRMMVAA